MWGPYVWTHGWIFPLMGFVICLGFLFLVFRAARAGGGFGCMGGHGHAGSGESADLRREVGELREEVRQLRTSH